MTTNWTHVEGHLYWKGVKLTFRNTDIPFLALMLGDSKGLVHITPGGDQCTVEVHYDLFFCVRSSSGLLRSELFIV